MLFYDWKKITREAGNSSRRIMDIIDSMLRTSMPRNRFDPAYKYYGKDFSGHSFLLNPYQLITCRRYKRHKDKAMADYIGLASYRNYGNYEVFGKTTLDLSHSPLRQDALENNTLLRIEGDQIHFIYEDYT